MLLTIKETWKTNPGEVVNTILFMAGIFGFAYLAFWIQANIIY